MCLGGCRVAECVRVVVGLQGVFRWLWACRVCSSGCGAPGCVQVGLQGVFRWGSRVCSGGAPGCVQVGLQGVFRWLLGSRVCSGGCGAPGCVQVGLQGVFRWLWGSRVCSSGCGAVPHSTSPIPAPPSLPAA